MTEKEIYLNAELLIMRGSETTATALSGLIFLLGHNPRSYRTLVEEIRGSFSSEEEITMRSTMPLQYLHAAVQEGLRLYPSASETPPRTSPGALVGGYYMPKGVSCQSSDCYGGSSISHKARMLIIVRLDTAINIPVCNFSFQQQLHRSRKFCSRTLVAAHHAFIRRKIRFGQQISLSTILFWAPRLHWEESSLC